MNFSKAQIAEDSIFTRRAYVQSESSGHLWREIILSLVCHGSLIIDYPRIVCSFQRSATTWRTRTVLVRREGRRARYTEYRTVRTNIERHLGSGPVYPRQAPLPLKNWLRVYTGQAYSVTLPHPEQTLVEERRDIGRSYRLSIDSDVTKNHGGTLVNLVFHPTHLQSTHHRLPWAHSASMALLQLSATDTQDRRYYRTIWVYGATSALCQTCNYRPLSATVDHWWILSWCWPRGDWQQRLRRCLPFLSVYRYQVRPSNRDKPATVLRR